MAIGFITRLLASGLLAWFWLLLLLITVRMLRGRVRVSGLLVHRLDGESAVVPERVAAIVAFPVVLGFYTMTALHADVSGATGPPSLPDVPQYLLSILTGGNGLYLAGKIARST
jgi:hypothetical protein